MKTKNNVQKTILRSVAVITSFVLISFTVSGQDFWKALLTNRSFNEIALAMSDNNKKPANQAKTNSAIPVEYILETAHEPALPLEYWMTSESRFEFDSNSESGKAAGFDVKDWVKTAPQLALQKTSDEKLQVEDWMISDEIWN